MRGGRHHFVEERVAAHPQRPIGAVEDRSRPGKVEQFEAGIDDEGDAMHWQKIQPFCHFRQPWSAIDSIINGSQG